MIWLYRVWLSNAAASPIEVRCTGPAELDGSGKLRRFHRAYRDDVPVPAENRFERVGGDAEPGPAG